jgi:hypothetical protein
VPEYLKANGGKVAGLVKDSRAFPAFVTPLKNRLADFAHFLSGN